MSSQTRIADVMTPHPYFIDIDAHLNSAKVMLTQYRLRHMPVKQDENIVAVISIRDIERAESHGVDTSIGTDTRVRDVCTVAGEAIVPPDEPLSSVLKRMADNHLSCVVIAKNNHLEGIFTQTDVCKQFGRLLEKLENPEPRN
ncbi:MAG: CBS domain-containing protein [Gammaproteobacteria bacterium]|nr:CBS domain-containing protein [Gammaproteobacteria bacterium]